MGHSRGLDTTDMDSVRTDEDATAVTLTAEQAQHYHEHGRVFGETDPNWLWTVGLRHLVVEIESDFPALDYSSIEPAGADHRCAHDPRS